MAFRKTNGELDQVRLYDLAMVASGDMPLSQLGEYDAEDLAHIRSMMEDFTELREQPGSLLRRQRAIPVRAQRVPVRFSA